MKKPTLRFRQVFEHPTHFKVTRPLGNPIVIAKKGLTPSLTQRLQAFADGGEVQENARDDKAMAVPEKPVEPQATSVSAGEAPLATTAPTVAAPVASAAPVAGSVLDIPSIEEMKAAAASRLAESTKELPIGDEGEGALAIPALEPEEALKREVASGTLQESFELAKPQPVDAKQRILQDLRLAQTQAQTQAAREQLDAVEREKMLNAQAKAYEAEKGKYQQISDYNRDLAKQASQDLGEMKNLGSYFSRLSTPSQIGTAISLAMGAFASGLAGIPNVAQRIYDNAIDKDIEKQRADAQSLLNRMVQAGNTQQHAEQMIRSISDNAMASQLQAAAARTASAKAKEAAMNASIALRAQADTRLRQIDKDNEETAGRKFQQGIASEQLRLAKEASARQDVEQLLQAKRLGIEEVKSQAQLAKETREAAREREGNTFFVGAVPIQASDKAVARKAQEQILGQSDFIAGAENALRLIQAKPFESYIPFTKAKQEAKLALKQMIERYPKGERFGRPLNVTASKVVQSGLPDVDDIVGGVLGNPEVVLRQLVEDAVEQRRRAIEYYGGGDQTGVSNATRYLAAQSPGRGFKPLASE